MKFTTFKSSLIIALGTTILPCLADGGKPHEVDQQERLFSVTEITIKPGEQISFNNKDSVTHNVFSKSSANAFTIKVQQPGEASLIDFKEEGVTEVRCAIHPKMKLIVTVKK